MSFRGIVGLPDPEYSTLGKSQLRHTSRGPISRGHGASYRAQPAATLSGAVVSSTPSFIRIFNLLLLHTQPSAAGLNDNNDFITSVSALHDVAFSPNCPMLGTGRHFAVYASPFDGADEIFRQGSQRAINRQVYCLKSPNLTSGEHNASAAAKEAFRHEYCNTALQELRVLLHPDLRSHDNIISLFGIDFQEDYDDCTIAWPVLVMEYAEFGTLDTLQQDIALDPALARILLLDIATGIQALHQCNIIHGDVKSENVLICCHAARKYVARLSDFGMSLINPDVASYKHQLPGGTFLWRAPEFDHYLSVPGLRQTDVYSFGLTAWRVMANHPNPFSLIPVAALGFQTAPAANEAVRRAKTHQALPQLVLQTLPVNGTTRAYARLVVEATLGKDPRSRDLSRAVSALATDQNEMLPELEPKDAYWAMEEPALVMEQLVESCPARLMQYAFKASVLRSLFRDLETVFNSNTEIASEAGWLLFQFASSPLFHVGKKDVDECCRILLRLCHLSSSLGQAVMVRYHAIHGKTPKDLNPEWLEGAALNGSVFAVESLRELYPEKYLQLMQAPLDFEPQLEVPEQKQAALLKCCREGDYESCKILLQDGAVACSSQQGMVSALHWMVSFHDERQINDLVMLLLGNGAELHAWEGEDDRLDFGRAIGTPLHWAIWHRNIPVVRALTNVDDRPEVKIVDRAIWIAAIMRFYDVLEILKDWILKIKDSVPSDYDWHSALIATVDQSASWLPRRLHHGSDEPLKALDRTLDTILAMYKPLAEDVQLMFAFALEQNQPILLRYLYKHLDLDKQNYLLKTSKADAALTVMAMGGLEVAEVLIERGLISPESEHGAQRWNPLQLCCIARQSDPNFAKRLIEIGCPVDGVGGTEESQWTSFFIAVSFGMYNIATMFLEHGANKDYLTGWVGGTTVTMGLLQMWPDIPLSRLKFLLEEVPRLGFGHVTFWGWPGAGGNILYALAVHRWSSYSAGYRIGETAKYILNQLEDKSCLNIIDKVGATALRMACANGNVEIIRALIEAGQDVNLAVGFSPLKNAKDWLDTCQKRENAALKGKPGAERRLATQLRVRADIAVELLVRHGAIDRGFFEAINNSREYVTSGHWQIPSSETMFEMFSASVDSKHLFKTGSTPLHPTTKTEFRALNSKRSTTQKAFADFGRRLDQANERYMQIAIPRYQPHNCHPWRRDHCISYSQPSVIRGYQAPGLYSPVTQRRPINSGLAATAFTGNLISRESSRAMQWQHMNQSQLMSGNPTFSITPTAHWQPFVPDSSPQRNPVPTLRVNTAQNEVVSSVPPAPRTVEMTVERIQHLLLYYFCEGGGGDATTKQRRDYAARILKEQLQVPITLNAPHQDMEHCEEFPRISKAVENCVEVLHVSGLTLVPELSDDGREFVVHVAFG